MLHSSPRSTVICNPTSDKNLVNSALISSSSYHWSARSPLRVKLSSWMEMGNMGVKYQNTQYYSISARSLTLASQLSIRHANQLVTELYTEFRNSFKGGKPKQEIRKVIKLEIMV